MLANMHEYAEKLNQIQQSVNEPKKSTSAAKAKLNEWKQQSILDINQWKEKEMKSIEEKYKSGLDDVETAESHIDDLVKEYKKMNQQELDRTNTLIANSIKDGETSHADSDFIRSVITKHQQKACDLHKNIEKKFKNL
ncbi:unnamed protein product [Didymodactylos carnosus]|uniref:Uncharacterized protein n=1 Tax=Didymodactylos carnosus TaxID=1234261 RepID=A0A814JD30_9BILA|nr:unnamed protein product [Didymodactylos carnosus]CAF1037710.1 unnamed protein product [Didymodactylos carnosus]CAF3714557.1 unnamed protein product [Didymodactylos carnosus]CAF3808203.1 unnamed protein product [Didymodactylos carnosus]